MRARCFVKKHVCWLSCGFHSALLNALHLSMTAYGAFENPTLQPPGVVSGGRGDIQVLITPPRGCRVGGLYLGETP